MYWNNTFITNFYVNNNMVSIMKKKIKEIISKDFQKNVTTIPWDGMHDEAVEKIMKIIANKA
mgnify:CR=1 FL=1